MKYHKEKKCPYCNGWQVYDRTLHHFSCPTCTRKPNTYLKQIKNQQKELARKIYEMVRNLSEHDIVRIRNNDFDNKHHCHDCNRILLPDNYPDNTIPAESQTNPDPSIVQRRRRPH